VSKQIFAEKSRKCISGHLVKRAINYYDIEWNLYFKEFRDFFVGRTCIVLE